MKVYDVTTELDGIIIFPSNTLEEILQNVRTILTTIKGTVPLDRDFGMSLSILDNPVNVIQSRLTTAVIETVEKYEPRVKVTEVSLDGDGMEGVLEPKVKVMIKS